MGQIYQKYGNICANNFRAAADMVANEIYNASFTTMLGHDDWCHGIIPVSAVGQDKVDQNNQPREDAVIHQENIDTAFVFCIYSHLARLISDQERRVKKARRDLYALRALLSTFHHRRELKKNYHTQQKILSELVQLRSILTSQQDAIFGSAIHDLHMARVSEIGRVRRI